MTKSTLVSSDIIYHILIDRFAGFSTTNNWDQPIFIGGNIKGIINKIPYLRDLGVTTIWISPFYRTNAYHGYHITDFFDIDPHFGTKQDIQNLVNEVHKNDMKIITDFVPNHCSHLHPFFIDAQKSENSNYKEWFYFTDWPDKYLCFLSISDLPKLRIEHPEVSNHIIDAALYWLSFGFDGFRLDHVIGPSNRFWKNFVRRIKKEYHSAVLIGEVWMQGIRFHELNTIRMAGKYWKWFRGNSSDTLLKTYVDILDGVLDFHVQNLLKDYMCYKKLTSEMLQTSLTRHYKKYPTTYLLPSFLDNHDMDRFLYTCKNKVSNLKNAAQVQFNLDQPAIIYYGTEIGMTQKESIWSRKAHGDILAREPMRWDNPNRELLDFYREIIKEKRKN